MDGLPWVHDVDDYLSAHEAATVRSSRTGSGAGDGAVAASVVALILLNGDIFPLGKLEALWKRASVHVCADGAANRLYDCFAVSTGAPSALEKPSMEQHEQARLEMERRRAEFVPSVIVGDLDSIRDEVRQFYADAGCDVQHVPDQDSHDFEKAVNVVKKRMDDLGARFKVAALGAFGGRLDQQFANINMLYRWDGVFDELVLLSDTNIAILLRAGDHVVRLRPKWMLETVGIIPVGMPCPNVVTKGLQWDLKAGEHLLAFGPGSSAIVSSSNAMKADLELTTANPVLWTGSLIPDHDLLSTTTTKI